MSVSGTVGDHATPLADYPHVRDNATLRDVFATLKAKYDSAEQFRSVLVLDGHDRLVGVLGLRDLLFSLLPDYLQHRPTHFEGADDDVESLTPLWQEDCTEQCREAARLPAGTHARPVTTTVAAAEPLTRAVYLFATLGTNILPVTEAGRVTGVLRIVDVLGEVAKAVLAEGEAA
ncbi:MAG: CBS domain-containing protein [Sulfurisoma sp.]|nr:CBS domain-containing protein [Sulfurisoma sp.]